MSQLRWGEYYTFRWYGSIHRNGPQGAHIISETSARSSRVTIGQGHEKFVCLNGVENLITDNADGSTYSNLRAIANTYRDCGALTFGKRGKKCTLTNGEITNKGNTLDEIQREEAQLAKPNSRLICDPFQQLPNGSSCHFFENKVHRKTGLRRGYMSGNKCMPSHDEKGCLRCPGIVLKRKHITLKSSGGKYGHWWIEIDAKTKNNTCPMGANAIGESYGWWPNQHVNITNTLTSVPGTLNGNGSVFKRESKLNDKQDPKHCQTADETLKVVIKPNRTCAEAKTAIRLFVSGYHGTWSWPFGQNCHSFQESLMQSARLYQEGTCRP